MAKRKKRAAWNEELRNEGLKQETFETGSGAGGINNEVAGWQGSGSDNAGSFIQPQAESFNTSRSEAFEHSYRSYDKQEHDVFKGDMQKENAVFGNKMEIRTDGFDTGSYFNPRHSINKSNATRRFNAANEANPMKDAYLGQDFRSAEGINTGSDFQTAHDISSSLENEFMVKDVYTPNGSENSSNAVNIKKGEYTPNTAKASQYWNHAKPATAQKDKSRSYSTYAVRNKKQYRKKSGEFYRDSLKKEGRVDPVDTEAQFQQPGLVTESRSEMLSRMANQEFFDKHEAEDERNIEYISQREESMSRRVRRYHGKHKSPRETYIRPDERFRNKDDFLEDTGAEVSDGIRQGRSEYTVEDPAGEVTGTHKDHDPDPKADGKKGRQGKDLTDDGFSGNGKPGDGISGDGKTGTGISGNGVADRYELKAEAAARKTQKARKRLRKRKEYRLVKQFDPTTGKVTYELETFKVPKKEKKGSPATVSSRRAKMAAHNFVHQKISEEEKENAGVEAAHKTELAGEEVVYRAGRLKKAVKARKVRKVAALEKKQFKAETNLIFNRYLEDNPEIKKKAIRKFIQKQRIKREYALALRKGAHAKEAAAYAQKAVQTTTVIAAKVKEFIIKHIGVIGAVAGFGLLFVVIATGVSSCGAMFGGGVAATMMGSYQSRPAELDKSDDAMTVRELELQNKIDSIETDHPDFDEYEYNLGEIGHDPFVLISYLSAMNIDFAAVDVDDQIEALFNEMYKLTLTPRIDIRTRTVTDPDTGEEYEEEYEVRVLQVELKSRPMEEVVGNVLSGDEKELYDTYMETRGALQQFYTPLDLDWYHMIKSYYGYRKNPTTGENQFHRGIDIAVPEGTLVYAAQDGTVSTATYDAEYGNYIVIADAKNYVTKYAHLATMNVSEGQDVKHGAIIGTTGSTGSSTGSHLHLECMADGEYYNPLFYFENGNGSIYGTTDPIGGSGDVAALFFEAEKYLGFPYVWGGSSPSTSFDCSGYVSYVLRHSGYYNMPRTTAQGIFNQCTPVSPSEARAGDLVFFTGTYNSGNPVSHVGIYAGNGQMIHCGDPIKYTSINTSYWQTHFYSFGRLSGH
ncbi:MAG: peptidoglycan DD-metalloendopeptidase family protein [Lachnospiraceae bacterium]|nr:peptidoglycan DD-metalloendopeptidase family protein [Lachnospiraceae bacterium]